MDLWFPGMNVGQECTGPSQEDTLSQHENCGTYFGGRGLAESPDPDHLIKAMKLPTLPHFTGEEMAKKLSDTPKSRGE